MLNIGIIGYGPRMDMLMDDLFALPYEVRVAAVADKDPHRAKLLMTKDGSPEEMHRLGLDKIDGMLRKCPMDPAGITFYEDAAALLENEKLDGVMVGTNCDTHTHFAQMVLERGLPLFLEKPVAVSREQLRVLAACEKAAKAPVVVSFPLRATALIREAKRILDAGVIGAVEHAQAYNDVPYGFVYYHDWYRDESLAHGLFLQKATHDIDVLNHLTGKAPTEVCAMKSKQIFKGEMPDGLRCSACEKQAECMESTWNIVHTRGDTPRNDWCCYAVDTGNEDSGSMLLRYGGGMHAAYAQNFFARKGAGRRGGRLYGYLGTLDYSFTHNTLTVYDHMSDKVTTTELGPAASGHGGGDIELMRNFVELMLGKTKHSIAPLSAGITSALACLCAKESAETNTFRPLYPR